MTSEEIHDEKPEATSEDEKLSGELSTEQLERVSGSSGGSGGAPLGPHH